METPTDNTAAHQPTEPVAPPRPATTATDTNAPSDLNQMLNPQPALGMQPFGAEQPPTVIDAKPLSPPAERRKTRRNGHVACLPKCARDMVNRMLWNGVPYKNISAALDELGHQVSERNISNWATGGFLEWRLEQDIVLQSRLDQDHIVDHLRRDNATEVPEVGLQAAATRLSQILLQKVARGEDVEANLPAFSQMVDLLSRLNREIAFLQKQRDDSRRSLGKAHDPARIQDTDEYSALEHERFYSDPDPDAELEKPNESPFLLAVPTSDFLAQQDAEEAEARKARHLEELTSTMRAFQKKPESNTNGSTPASPSN